MRFSSKPSGNSRDSSRREEWRRQGEVVSGSPYASSAISSQLQVIADLNALTFTASHDREARDQAVKALQDAIAKTAQGKNDDAIENLLDAIDKLRRIAGRDISAYRLAVDRWLQELELEWLNAQLGSTH